MIASIRGALRGRGDDWVHVEVGGVTFAITVPASVAASMGEEGREVVLYTRLTIRDDEPQLFGFPSPQVLQLYNMLTTVSGIGPRSALNLLSARAPDAIGAAILAGDSDVFTGVPGIGKRTAARILLELKPKLEKDGLPLPPSEARADAEAVSALTALGYTGSEARAALRGLGSEEAGLGLEERVRMALTNLARGG